MVCEILAGSPVEPKPRPPVKWAGGKGQLIPQFEPLFPKESWELYLEPFVGGGAVFFHLLPCKAVLIDSNEELINFYLVVNFQIKPSSRQLFIAD